MTPSTAATWICPECSGAWVRNFVFDHDRITCSLGKADDATQQADFERLQTKTSLDRAATSTEVELFAAIAGFDPIEAEFRSPTTPAQVSPSPITTVTNPAPGIHHRIVAGLDPDALAKEITA